MLDYRALVKAGVHFGHQKTRWCPKMAPYIWGYKNNIHLIDVAKTVSQLEKAAKFLESLAAENKTILWVGTKKAAQDIIFQSATNLKQPFVNHRWIGGTLSNNSQVKKSVTKLLHFEDIISKEEKSQRYTKKELSTYQKVVDRLQKNVGGIRTLAWPVAAVVLVDVNKEHSALKEAASMGIPVIALVDTNSDPSLVNYVIPANDDAPRAIKLLVDYLEGAVRKGQESAAAASEEKKAAKRAEIAMKAKSDEAAAVEKKKTVEAAAVKKPAVKKESPKEVIEEVKPAKEPVKTDMK